MNNIYIGSKQILVSTIILFLLNILCLSCSKVENLEIPELIVGEWGWVETINVWTGIKYTPDSEGYTRTLIFRNDNTVESYKDGELISIVSYQTREIVYNPGDPDSDTAMKLIIKESESYFSIDYDTLTISQAHVDGPVSKYKRIE